MSNRYDTSTKHLDLSQFESDKFLIEQGLYLPLCRVNVANCVVSVITDHIPEVVGIDISRNEMYNVTCLAPLAVKCKELRSLKMAGNRVSRNSKRFRERFSSNRRRSRVRVTDY